ncbi:DUF3987 domain-containing protein [Dolichospermum sp. UHCC 0259]|uniref:DUF3987 domain-containing protein n=1 Tax=Dolichospermum sp. UHCC 0259 TaxID=2590010 RepID=UPI0014487311|nr:DUF3987 domain-containing protein [Dolichospermum sp. UHCC 0259]MTJ48385.1 DUF3987 domain-containing protein [Dolichospermum sp. UHCC 0259]
MITTNTSFVNAVGTLNSVADRTLFRISFNSNIQTAQAYNLTGLDCKEATNATAPHNIHQNWKIKKDVCIDDLIKLVAKGYAIRPGITTSGQNTKDAIEVLTCIALDFDNKDGKKWTTAQTQNDDFIKRCAAFFYYTPSYDSLDPKLRNKHRVVFVFSREVTPPEYELLANWLKSKYPGCDPSIYSFNDFIYGGKGRDYVYKIGEQFLPVDDILPEAKQYADNQKTLEKQRKNTATKKTNQPTKESNTNPDDSITTKVSKYLHDELFINRLDGDIASLYCLYEHQFQLPKDVNSNNVLYKAFGYNPFSETNNSGSSFVVFHYENGLLPRFEDSSKSLEDVNLQTGEIKSNGTFFTYWFQVQLQQDPNYCNGIFNLKTIADDICDHFKVARYKFNEKKSEKDLRNWIADILDTCTNPTELILKKKEVRIAQGLTPQEVDRLFDAVENELNKEASKDAVFSEFVSLVNTPKDLDTSDFIPPDIAQSFKQLSKQMGVPEMAFLTALLPCVSSLVRGDLKVKVRNGWVESLHIWSALNARSGSKKTSVIKTCLAPIKQLEAIEQTRYKAALKEYQKIKDNPELEAPTKRDYYFSKVTMERVINAIGNQPYPVLIYRDELVGFFNAFGQYKGGKGDDLETFIELYDGSGAKADTLSSGSVFITSNGLSIIGGTQGDVLAGLLKKLNDPQGLWARHNIFSYTAVPVPPSDHEDDYLINDQLTKLYEGIIDFNSIASGLFLSKDATKVFEKYRYQNEILTLNENLPGLITALAKIPGKVIRIAGIMHIIKSASTHVYDLEIDADTLNKAIKLCDFYHSHIKLIYAQNGSSSTELAPELVRLFDWMKRQPDKTASLRDIQLYCLQRKNSSDINDICQQLVSQGRGEIQTITGKGRPSKSFKLFD